MKTNVNNTYRELSQNIQHNIEENPWKGADWTHNDQHGVECVGSNEECEYCQYAKADAEKAKKEAYKALALLCEVTSPHDPRIEEAAEMFVLAECIERYWGDSLTYDGLGIVVKEYSEDYIEDLTYEAIYEAAQEIKDLWDTLEVGEHLYVVIDRKSYKVRASTREEEEVLADLVKTDVEHSADDLIDRVFDQ